MGLPLVGSSKQLLFMGDILGHSPWYFMTALKMWFLFETSESGLHWVLIWVTSGIADEPGVVYGFLCFQMTLEIFETSIKVSWSGDYTVFALFVLCFLVSAIVTNGS